MFYTRKFFFLTQVFLCGFFINFSFSMELCKTAFAQMTDSSAAKVFAYTAGSVALYNGIQHAISAGICPELYLSKANCKQLNNKKRLLAAGSGLLYGIKSSLKSAFLLGAMVTAASRVGSWPKLQVADLVKPANWTYTILTPLSFFCRAIAAVESAAIDIDKFCDTDSWKQRVQNYGEDKCRQMISIAKTHNAIQDLSVVAALALPVYLLGKRYFAR